MTQLDQEHRRSRGMQGAQGVRVPIAFDPAAHLDAYAVSVEQGLRSRSYDGELWTSDERSEFIDAARAMAMDPAQKDEGMIRILSVTEQRFARQLTKLGAVEVPGHLPLVTDLSQKLPIRQFAFESELQRSQALARILRTSDPDKAAELWERGPGLGFGYLFMSLFGSARFQAWEEGSRLLAGFSDESAGVSLLGARALHSAPALLFGALAMGGVPTSRVSPFYEFLLLQSLRLHPELLPTESVLIHDFIADPYLAASHDVYHRLIGSGMDPMLLQMRQQVAMAFSKAGREGVLTVGTPRPALRFFDGILQDLVDCDQQQAFYLRRSLGLGLFLPLKTLGDWKAVGLSVSDEFWSAFHRELLTRLDKNPDRAMVMSAFEVFSRTEFSKKRRRV